MSCFFGHNFGKIESDGFQYCTKCGKAIKPNPCENGHLWVDVAEKTTNWRNNHTGELVRWNVEVAQKCSVCGDRRSVWKF